MGHCKFRLFAATPRKIFTQDWIHINAKPVDYPFGPFTDSFTAVQHKYGPYIEMQKLRIKKEK
jgi:thiosulfate dehydrogenase